MFQSSLKPGLLFQRCNSAYVARFPVRYRTVSRADRQYVPRTSTSTPSTSKIRILGCNFVLAEATESLEQKQHGVATAGRKCALAAPECVAPRAVAHCAIWTSFDNITLEKEMRAEVHSGARNQDVQLLTQLIRGWLCCCSLRSCRRLLQISSLVLQIFQFVASIGKDLSLLLQQLGQPLFLVRGCFVDLPFEIVQKLFLGLDVAPFPGDHF